MTEHSDHCIRCGSGTHPDYKKNARIQYLWDVLNDYGHHLDRLNRENQMLKGHVELWVKESKKWANSYTGAKEYIAELQTLNQELSCQLASLQGQLTLYNMIAGFDMEKIAEYVGQNKDLIE